MTTLDIDRVRRHLHALAEFLTLRARGLDPRPLVDLHPDVFDRLRNRYTREVFPEHVLARYTRLCAWRAHARGRRHLAPRTNLAEACWILGVPCRDRLDANVPGGWTYRPITDEVLAGWFAGLETEYMKEDERLPAG
jgi:hypothetical protein